MSPPGSEFENPPIGERVLSGRRRCSKDRAARQVATAGSPARVRPVPLAAVYPARYFVNGGGLISYGPDPIDIYRRAAGYVDRILNGEKPADLPVQVPTKYQLVINMKTAKAARPRHSRQLLLARADEVIE